jgi:hypothetical protein
LIVMGSCPPQSSQERDDGKGSSLSRANDHLPSSAPGSECLFSRSSLCPPRPTTEAGGRTQESALDGHVTEKQMERSLCSFCG